MSKGGLAISFNVRDIRSFAECNGAKFGEMASRAISRISLVKRPEWSEAERERSVALAYIFYRHRI